MNNIGRQYPSQPSTQATGIAGLQTHFLNSIV